MPNKMFFKAILLAAISVFAAVQEQPTPYDLIRPVWPLTWDSAAFDRFDTSITSNRGPVPKNRTPADYKPNEFIPDTLNQAYLDNINIHISPIRINQAGYLVKDPEKQFYYIGTATTFEVVDINGNSLPTPVTGTFQSTGVSTKSGWGIVAGQKATTMGKGRFRYQVETTGQSGTIQVGMLGNEALPTDTRLRIKVGNELSNTFIISDNVYSMVRAATLKFYGINRSGNSESWFHPASHTKDGMGSLVNLGRDVLDGPNPALAGSLQGGWYDCGDHLKESLTQMYALMVAAVMAATNPDADDDFYAYNHGETVNTDGIPDMLREAKHGADFVLRSYVRAKGVIDDMALSVGDFAEHTWWGRPEAQDNIPSTTEGAASSSPEGRLVRLGELGANVSAAAAAGLAILGKDYQEYDQAFADSCLKVAIELYDFAKSLALGKTYTHNKVAAGWSSEAYPGNNEFQDEISVAAIALLYATKDKTYLEDAVERDLSSYNGGKQTKKSMDAEHGVGMFRGGWFAWEQGTLWKAQKNTSWANCYAFALYAFYKMILNSPETAASYGISEDQRLEYAEDILHTMIPNLSDMSKSDGVGGSKTITLPSNGNWNTGSKNTVTYDPIWFTMFTDQPWIYNRYQTGNIVEVLFYADVAKDFEGVNLPQKGIQDWKSAEMYQLGINQMNYMLGVNPWDISFLLGVGDKNDAHPHHRAANPEGKNVPGDGYKYNPPVGALFGGVAPTDSNIMRPTNYPLSWNDYFLSETCIDATAIFITASMMTSAKSDRKRAPGVNVEIRHVSMDSAIVYVKLNVRGTAAIKYGTGETMDDMNTIATPEKNNAGVAHEIVLHDLKPGTTYYFYAVGTNAYEPTNSTLRFQVDSTQTPFSFTTLNTIESADIQNITVCNVTGDSAEIMWYTPNGEYESKLYWGTEFASEASGYTYNTGAGNADVSGLPTKFHYVKIGGLKEKTLYYFMVESNGVFVNVNSETGAPLKFTTTVTHYDFSVKTYQYPWDDMAMMNINVFNNEDRSFDSLTIRLYMRGTDEITTDIGMGTDICQAYDEAGYNKPCSDATKEQLERALRDIKPEKIEDTYDAASGTWQWYFPLELGSTVIRSASRLRFDVRFDHRSPWPPYKDLMNEAPNKKLYCLDGGKWYAPSYEFTGAAVLNENPGDWSWMPHSKANGDYADYPGMPCINKDLGDDDFEAAPVNPYTAVYRKDEFIWGYSPSMSEMSTKRAHYDLEVTFDPPFNVSDGSYVELAQTNKTVYVTGHAHITEDGYITKIWANGQLVSGSSITFGNDKLVYNKAETEIIAQYNLATDLWDLKIPVKMSVGSNKVDITVFAGPNPNCEECTANGGCAFVNRNYYTLFTRPNLTDGVLTIRDVNGGTVGVDGVVDPASNQQFVIYLTDKDKKGTKSPVQVKVLNGKKQDSIIVTLKEVGEGMFQSEPITAISLSKGSHENNQISFFAGDTIYVEYQDPDDEEDYSKITAFYAESNYPTPQKILAQDANCDGAPDQLLVVFSSALVETFAFDSIRFYIEGMPDTTTVKLSPDDYIGKNEITVSLGGIPVPVTSAPTGKAVLSITSEGVTNLENISITDGILPTLTSVTILENPNHESELDTVMIAFSEPVTIANESAWPIATNGNAGTITVVGKPTTLNDGLSWQYTVSGNDKGKVIPVGGTAMVATDANITDKAMNALIPGGGCTPSVTIAETPKPVPVTLAQIRDIEGDGYPDEIYIKFKKHIRPKDMLDSFVVDWGRPSIVKSFIMSFDSSSGNVVPKDDFWTLKDSIAEPRTVNITADSTAIVIDTVSILTITIPTSLSYPLGTTSGAYESESGFFGSIVPRLGPAGGFFDKSYPLVDFCPPIVMKAVKETANDFSKLTVTFSEPLTDIGTETLHYIERKRGSSEGVFLFPKSATHTDSKTTFLYSDESDDAINIGDFVRLDTNATTSRFKDKASNFPTRYNPWVKVSGSSAEKTRFKVSMEQAVTQVKQGQAFYTPETQPTDKEVFRLTVVGDNGKESIVDGNTIGVPLDATYTHGGPVFQLDISMAAAMMGGKTQKYLYDMMLSIEMNLYDNLGQFIANKTFKMDFAENTQWRDAISEDGILHLNLEWVAHDGTAPVSDKGRKLGTGAYISKFDFTAVKTCTEDVNEEEEGGIKCKIGQKDKTTDNTTKTFGFKRSKAK